MSRGYGTLRMEGPVENAYPRYYCLMTIQMGGPMMRCGDVVTAHDIRVASAWAARTAAA